MNKLTKTHIIDNLYLNIDLSKINYDIIKANCIFLYDIFKQIKAIWVLTPKITGSDHVILDKSNNEYKQIISNLTNCYMNQYQIIIDYISKTKRIIKINKGNIYFYYLDIDGYNTDIELLNQLATISITFGKYAKIYNNTENNLATNSTNGNKSVIIIWIPINAKRDFKFDKITKDNLATSIENFNAFTASGVTFGENPTYTIITRYEEIIKLLLHELIHNFNIDGSNHHSHNDNLISKYKKVKNKKSSLTIKNYDYAYSIYESYTELLSTYFNIVYRNIALSDDKELMERFKTEIIIELLYSYNTIGNLIKLNGYKDYNDFFLHKKFYGDICVYEYYYLKGLLYNNYKITLCKGVEAYKKNYSVIMNVNKDDDLLREVCDKSIKQDNFGYIFY